MRWFLKAGILPAFLIGAVAASSALSPVMRAQEAVKVPELPLAELTARAANYKTISLAPAANRDFQDTVAGDGRGGWTDQGANSVVGMPTGRQVFGGIPFEISAQPSRQVVVLRGQNKAEYPTSAEVPVGAKGAALYFLHTAAWAAPTVGTYTVHYEDGASETITIRNGTEIGDWWQTLSSNVARVGWKGANPEHSPITMSLFAWRNPRPDTTITRLVAQTPGDASFLMLAGLTVGDGPFLPAPSPKLYDTSNWFPYAGVDVARRRGTALDMSYLLDAPAGKHGRVQRRGEDYVFANGKKVKFWGTNMVAGANFPTHEQADRWAEQLAQMGVNMTRHHHMDADWSRPNLFGNKDGTLSLDAEALDRLDYLVAQLQKRGIYQYFDLVVNRRAFASDGISQVDDVASGYKIEGEFDPHLIFLQENLTRQLLNHRNPYTGKTYGRDAGVAMMEIINEDSLFYRRDEPGDFSIQSDYYRTIWNSMWNTWLLERFGDRAALQKRWATTEPNIVGLNAEEDPARATVVSISSWGNDGWKKYSRQRALDNFRFYYDTQLAYFRRMTNVARASGYSGLITGSNHWTSLPADLHANAQLDFIDRHDYWAHPSGGYGYAPGVTFEPGSMTRHPGGGMIKNLAYRRVRGFPYIVTEWQASAPNDYRQEGTLLVGAYCAFQNWSATQFAWSHGATVSEALGSNFDIANQPGMMGVWPAVSLIVHRGDVREAPLGHFLPLSDTQVFDPATRTGSQIPNALAIVAKTGIELTGVRQVPFDFSALLGRQVKGTQATSTTSELSLDHAAGLFRVNTPRSQGFTGFAGGKTQSFANLQVTLQNPYGLVTASALETAPLSSARRILISAIGNAMNTGMEIDENGNRVRAIGGAPVLVEPMLGLVTLSALKGDLSRAVVYHLDASGQRAGQVPLTRTANSLSFEMKPEHRAMHYEVVR